MCGCVPWGYMHDTPRRASLAALPRARPVPYRTVHARRHACDEDDDDEDDDGWWSISPPPPPRARSSRCDDDDGGGGGGDG